MANNSSGHNNKGFDIEEVFGSVRSTSRLRYADFGMTIEDDEETGHDEVDYEMRSYNGTPGWSNRLPRSRRSSYCASCHEDDYDQGHLHMATIKSTNPRSRRPSGATYAGDDCDLIQVGVGTLNKSRRNSGVVVIEDNRDPEANIETKPGVEGQDKDKDKDKDKDVAVLDDSIFRRRMTIAGGFLDIALFTSNCEQLKSLLEIKDKDSFYEPVLGLLITSMILQAICGLTLFMLGFLITKNKADKLRGDVLNHITFGLIALITIVNIFISSFGVKEAFIRRCNLALDQSKSTEPISLLL